MELMTVKHSLISLMMRKERTSQANPSILWNTGEALALRCIMPTTSERMTNGAPVHVECVKPSRWMSSPKFTSMPSPRVIFNVMFSSCQAMNSMWFVLVEVSYRQCVHLMVDHAIHTTTNKLLNSYKPWSMTLTFVNWVRTREVHCWKIHSRGSTRWREGLIGMWPFCRT